MGDLFDCAGQENDLSTSPEDTICSDRACSATDCCTSVAVPRSVTCTDIDGSGTDFYCSAEASRVDLAAPCADDPCTVSDCCLVTPVPFCSEFQCAGQFLSIDASDVTRGDDESTCCVVTCAKWATGADCSDGMVIIDGVDSTAGGDEAVCCRQLMCSEYTCPADAVVNTAADTIPGNSPDACCTTFAVHQISLDGTAEDVEANGGGEAVKLTFQRSIAGMLDGVEVEMVVVNSMTYGSIIFEFFIRSLSTADDAALTSQLVGQLANGASVEVAGRSVVDFATVRPPGAASTTSTVVSAVVPAPAPAPSDDDGVSIGTPVVVLLLVVLFTIVGCGVHQKKQRAEEMAKGERSESVENPMSAGVGSSAVVWTELVDKNSGRTYYVNRQTYVTTWERPAQLRDTPTYGNVASGATPAGTNGRGRGSDPVWKEIVDKTSGKTYYVNRQSKVTTWQRPAELGNVASVAAGGGDWVEHFDKERNKAYFYNNATKETTWARPPGIVAKEQLFEEQTASIEV